MNSKYCTRNHTIHSFNYNKLSSQSAVEMKMEIDVENDCHFTIHDEDVEAIGNLINASLWVFQLNRNVDVIDK